MKKISKITAIILSIIMAVSTMPVTSFAYTIGGKDVVSGSNEICRWEYDEDTDTMYIDGDVIRPYADAEESECTKIPIYYYDDNNERIYFSSDFDNLIIGKNVTALDGVSICCSNYNDFLDVKTVSFENGSKLREIGVDAFSYSVINDIELPQSLEAIFGFGFYNSHIRSITLPENVSRLGGSVFAMCKEMITADFSKTHLESTRNYTFKYCDKLKNVYLPASIKTIGKECFMGCTALRTMNIPRGVETIDEYAFYKSGINKISIPETVSEIKGKAFADISYTEFGETKGIEKIFIYSTTVRIENNAFDGVDKSAFTIYGYPNSTARIYAENNGYNFISLYDYDANTPPSAEDFIANSQKGTWDYGTWQINDNSNGCRELFILGSGKMNNCDIVDLNGRETTFAQVAYENDVELVFVQNGINSIPDNFMYIDSGTRLDKLKYVVLPDRSIYSIGSYAFANTGLKWILNNYCYCVLLPLCNMKNMGSSMLLCPDIRQIGEYAFAYTRDFTGDAILPVYLEEISEGLFYRSDVNTVAMYGYVGSIGKRAFASCMNLDSIDIPISVKSIYEDEDNPKENALGYYYTGEKDNHLEIRTREESVAYNYAQKHGFDYTYFYGNPIGNGTIQCGGKTNYSDKAYQNSYGGFHTVDWNYYAEDKCVHIVPTTGEGDRRNALVAPTTKAEIDCEFAEVNYYVDDFLGTLIIDGQPTNTKKIFKGYVEVDTVIVEDLTAIKACGVFALFNPVHISLPDTLKTLDYNVFKDCTRLTSINIPDSVTSIGTSTFMNNTSLEGVNLGNGITTIPYNLFNNCKNLKFVGIGNKVTRIGARAFSDCVSLQEIDIPDSVVSIGEKAFYNCISVQEVTIGSGVNDIGANAFSQLIYCQKMTVNSDLPYYLSAVEDPYYSPRTCFSALGDFTAGCELVIGENVTVFDCNTFDMDDNNVTKLTIEGNARINGLTTCQFPALREFSVGNGCSRYYTYDASLYDTNNYLIAVPRAKENVTIKSDCTKISDNACAMTSAKKIKVPQGVKVIDAWAFADSNTLKEISFEGNALRRIEDSAFINCTRLKTFVCPDGVSVICPNTFQNCTNLASVILPEGTKEIYQEAFRGCTSLRTVVLPESLNAIYQYAFADCMGLEELYIWNTSFASNAFDNCPELKIYTMAASDAYEYARDNGITYSAFTDEDCFYDECAVKLDVLAGYLGICSDGHGDIQWLTVYEADCDNDGYIIGVCEYCSEILDEQHIEASGHNYSISTCVPATESTKGITIYTCSNCNGTYTEYTNPTTQDYIVESHIAHGKVVIAQSKNANTGVTPARGATITIDGNVLAVTGENGEFSVRLDTGAYEATVSYSYGFSRNIVIIIEDEDVECGNIPVIGCDFNKDGKVDDVDSRLFQMVISSQADDPSYLYYVDMNNDGYINAKDRVYIKACTGIDSRSYHYPPLVFSK